MSAKIRGLLEHDLLWGLRLGAAVVLCIQVLTWVGLGLTFWTWTLTYVLAWIPTEPFGPNIRVSAVA